MINKNRFGVANDKKLLRKIGKQWVTVSALTLTLLGGGLVASSVVTHADATTNNSVVETKDTNSIKKQINNNLDKAYQATQSASGSSVSSSKATQSSVSSSASSADTPSNVELKATNMHDALMLNAAAKSSNNSNSLSNLSANTKSSVASSGSVLSSSKPSFNSAYQSYMAKMSGVDSEVAKDNVGNIQSNTKNKRKPVLKDSNDGLKPESYYFSGDVTKTGSDDGLNYKVYANGGVEFTDGTANSDLSNFAINATYYTITNSDVAKAKAIKFDNSVNVSHVTNMSHMLSGGATVDIGGSSLRLIDFGNNFDTSHVTNMSNMLSSDNVLQFINLGANFNTSHVTNMSSMFQYDSDLQSINWSNNFDTSHVTNMSNMFQFDRGLKSLILPNSFNTSNVTNMSNMFQYTKNLRLLTLSNTFDTSRVTNMSNMLNTANDGSVSSLIQKIIIQSPKTRFTSDADCIVDGQSDQPAHFFPSDSNLINDDEVDGNYHKQLPEKDNTGTNYTLSTPNDFSKGNVGTFVNYRNPAPNSDNAIINFQSNGKAIKTITTPKQKFATPINLNNFIPTNYELVNPNQKIVADGGTYVVPVKINYDEVINSLVNEASSESAAIASYEASSTSISNADKWVQSNSNSAQSADSWIANNSSNATHASSQASTNSSAISSLSASTNANHSADNSNIVSLSNSIASASTAISSNSTTDSSIVNSLASSASHAMVVGTAYLTLLYKKGDRTDGQVLRLHINGNIGDSDIVINPQDYDRDGYSIAPSDKDWHIPFDYPTVNSISHGDFSRYNRENTFVYNAQPISINIDYVDTQTGNPVPNTSTQKLSDVAYDGDTIDLQDANSSNGLISVDGNNYRLNLPTGYHLAHGNNYILVNQNATKPVSMVNPLTGRHELRMMPLMKLTLGITPHFNKPTSNSSVAPKPSSASSATPQSASSASTEPSSASVVPSSASQSVAPSISTASSMVTPSSTASVTPVMPSVTSSSATSTMASSAPSSSIASASVSMKPSPTNINPVSTIARPVTHHAYHKRIAKKPITHRISHKNMAKHDTQRLNHHVTQDKHKLNIVEHHMKARKSIIRKAIHAKRTIKHAKKRLHYLRHNKRHVAHALRRITRNKVTIKHAKRIIRTAKQARPRFVHAKAAPVGPTTDKFTAPSIKASVVTPKVHAKSTATTYANRKKLLQTSEATDHAGIVAIILMIMSVILAGFDRAFGREHN